VSACPPLQAALAPVGSPLFTHHPWNACRGYAPRKHRSRLALAAAVMLPSPQGVAGRLLHTRSISGLFIPFTDVPAYVLPVYASSGTLPCPTQDSVPDCWLRFVRAAIAGGWTVYACKAQPSPNRTGYLRLFRLSHSLGSVGPGSLHLAYPYPRLPGQPAARRPGGFSPLWTAVPVGRDKARGLVGTFPHPPR
jgi:hypothetical protein